MADDSLDGRRFRPVENEDGDVDAATTFEYHQDEDLVRARYSGGAIRLGFLVGVRREDSSSVLNRRYAPGGSVRPWLKPSERYDRSPPGTRR